LGGGSAIVVLEELDHATRRGARIYAEVVGYGANSDAHHIAAPAPEHKGAQACFKIALGDAKIDPASIMYCNAHGTSTVMNDLVESAVLRRVLGEQPLVTSTKAMTGHTLGAAGGVETALAVLALQHGLVPPTVNLRAQDPEVCVEVVAKEARATRTDLAVKTSLGFGGHNAALVLARA
jgi:3-oxoacyl-[acyl-carrier-protein] synthase II